MPDGNVADRRVISEGAGHAAALVSVKGAFPVILARLTATTSGSAGPLAWSNSAIRSFKLSRSIWRCAALSRYADTPRLSTTNSLQGSDGGGDGDPAGGAAAGEEIRVAFSHGMSVAFPGAGRGRLPKSAPRLSVSTRKPPPCPKLSGLGGGFHASDDLSCFGADVRQTCVTCVAHASRYRP